MQILALQPQISKKFLNHYDKYILTEGQSNFGNKIPFTYLHILLIFSSFFSKQPNELYSFPTWLIMYSCQIVLPGIGMSAIAIKIISKSGKDLKREFFGVTATSIPCEDSAKLPNIQRPETAIDFLKSLQERRSNSI